MSEKLISTPAVFGDNGNFLLERELGAGGMGGVYMGRDKMLDRPVAVKVMLKELGADAEFVEKFKMEAQAAARLIHPNIVQVYSYGISEGMPYIAMELAAGGSLFSLMNVAPGKTDVQRVLKICQQTALALQCATDQGVIHGDVKPENILLDANGNAKLVDFGLAAMQKDTDEIWGTPYYISPEKVKKDSIDFRSDMYSLGATLYHALTGVAPFEGEDSVAVVKKRFEGVPRKPSEIRPEITPAVDSLVMKMIAQDRDSRYPSFEALLQAFTDVLTSGLTKKSDKPDVKRPGTASVAKASPNRLSARTRRMTPIKKPGAVTMKPVSKPVHPNDVSSPEAEDENEGGNLGAKVALFVVGGLVAIGAVVGGLYWFISADAKAREADVRAQIVSKISEARKSIQSIREKTVKFDEEFKDFSARASESCTAFTAELKKLLPDFADGMKPQMTAELIQAIALTNPVQQVAAAAAAPTNAPAAKPAPAKEKASADPKSDKAAAPADGASAVPAGEAAPDAAAEAAPTAPVVEKKAPPMALKDIAELWERAYSCQACQIKISLAAKKILTECDKAAAITDETEEGARALGDLSLSVKDLYEQMTSSPEVTTVRKGIAFIKSKGEKTVKQTIRELTIQKAEADRAAKFAAQKAAEEERVKRKAEEKAALIAQETTEIAQKFDAIAAQGCFRQLDWKSAIRQLQSASESFKTAEGQIATQLQVKKVNQMKKVQDIFIEKIKGYVFKGKLKGATVVKIDDKDIHVKLADKKSKKLVKIPWQKFYRDYPGNLNEIINHFIVNGRKYSALNKLDWADAMAGTALTMRLVCAEVDGATAKAEQVVKDVVEQFPEYEKTIKEIFPDISLEASSAQENGKESEEEEEEEE